MRIMIGREENGEGCRKYNSKRDDGGGEREGKSIPVVSLAEFLSLSLSVSRFSAVERRQLQRILNQITATHEISSALLAYARNLFREKITRIEPVTSSSKPEFRINRTFSPSLSLCNGTKHNLNKRRVATVETSVISMARGCSG